MKDKKKKNRLWSGEFKLKVVIDIIENELSYSQAARKYDMYLSSASLNDTLPARWVYQYRLYGKERFFQTPKDYRKNPIRKFHTPSKEVEQSLELKVKHLEMELEYTKKLIALVQKQEQTKIPSSQGTKAKICIKRSTSNIRLPKSVYYYYEHHKKTDKYHDIKILISEIFEASNRTYGYRRIKLALQNFYQVKIAYKTVVKLMKELHIVCKVRKKRYRYISQISNKITPNLLKIDFKKDEPNVAWVTDVSEFRFNSKHLYLSVIQDLYNGGVKGYQISRSQNQDLILKTLKKAINPNEDLSKLLIHSDQGILYQSPKYRNYLKKSSFTQSMSAKGNAYDNAVVESFFGTLKCETIYLQKVKSLFDLIRTIDEYIYWYNHDRIKLTLGGYSPIQYRLMNQQMI